MSYEQLLNLNYGNTADGAAYASSTTITDVSPAPQFAVPAGYCAVGTTFRLKAHGIISTTGSPTMKLGFYWGGVSGIALTESPATAVGAGAASWPWWMEYEGTVRTIGSSGSIMGMGVLYLPTGLSAWTPIPLVDVSGTANGVVTIDTTIQKAITAGATWGTNSASNTLTVHRFTVEDLSRV